MGRLPKQVTDARRERLRELLARTTYLPLQRVCQELGVSQATARRDLASLEVRKLVRRTHGGALSPYAGALGDFELFFPTFDQRRGDCEPAKRAIARAAASLVKLGDTVFIDAGTTCFAVAEEIERSALRGITVVTHNLAVAVKLGAIDGIRVEVLGGTLLPRQAALFGDEACRAISARRMDLALLCAEGFDTSGVWNSQEDVVRLQRSAMAAAARVVLLIDSSKLRRQGPVLLSPWTAVHLLVTDASPAKLKRAHIDPAPNRVLIATL